MIWLGGIDSPPSRKKERQKNGSTIGYKHFKVLCKARPLQNDPNDWTFCVVSNAMFNDLNIILCLLVETVGDKDSNPSLPKTRSNSVPAYGATSTAKKNPMPVTSPSSPPRTASLRVEHGDGSLPPHERLNKLFERLERGDVERLQDIGKAVKSFDR